jgi:RNA polymerase sigma-70 factor (ECF subfamily)
MLPRGHRETQSVMGREETVDIASMTRGMTRGDEEPFRTFYVSYFPRLYRYLLVVTRGEEELVRDCLQDTMLRVVRNIRPFTNEAMFWGWLSRVARTAFLYEMRKRKRRQIEATYSDQTIRAETENRMLRLIDEAIDDLEDEDRGLIIDSYFNKQSHATLAQERGITAKAVESRIARIRKRMRVRILESVRNER